MCPRERFSLYKSLSMLFLCYTQDWATLLHFIYFHCLLLVTIYLIKKLYVTYNFLLLHIGFDTLTYRKDYDRSPILVGHQPSRT